MGGILRGGGSEGRGGKEAKGGVPPDQVDSSASAAHQALGSSPRRVPKVWQSWTMHGEDVCFPPLSGRRRPSAGPAGARSQPTAACRSSRRGSRPAGRRHLVASSQPGNRHLPPSFQQALRSIQAQALRRCTQRGSTSTAPAKLCGGPAGALTIPGRCGNAAGSRGAMQRAAGGNTCRGQQVAGEPLTIPGRCCRCGR